MGRRRHRLDEGIALVLRLWKHFVNPLDTVERILRGPVFGRALD